jgi:phosphate-selective porin OprO/OprP
MLEYACSSDPNGIFLRYRYEGQAPGGVKSGDAFFACYSGLNYYLYGHKLKLMSGVKYTFMDGDTQAEDFNGWTGLVGLRMAY